MSMTPEEMGRKLVAMGKKGWAPNHQDNKLLFDAGRALLKLAETVQELQEKAYNLEEQLAIREEMDHQGDPEIDRWPPDDPDPEPEEAPEDAVEDFWADDWPLGG